MRFCFNVSSRGQLGLDKMKHPRESITLAELHHSWFKTTLKDMILFKKWFKNLEIIPSAVSRLHI